MTCYFDGGASGRRGSGGFVGYLPSGDVHVGRAEYYGLDAPTNNTSELRALVGLLECLQDAGIPEGVRYVLVLGDSRLVIDFCTRRARPGVDALFVGVRLVQRLRRELRGSGHGGPVEVVFGHVPRDENRMADWLARYARATRGIWDIHELLPGIRLGDEPPPDPERSPHVCVDCPRCGAAHVDVGRHATVPHKVHECTECGTRFTCGRRAIGVPGGPPHDGVVPVPADAQVLAVAHAGVRRGTALRVA